MPKGLEAFISASCHTKEDSIRILSALNMLGWELQPKQPVTNNEDTFEYPNGVRLPPVHPGKTLYDEIVSRDLAVIALASALSVPIPRLASILSEEHGIDGEMALRLGRYFDNGAEFWMQLQSNYDLAIARRRWDNKIRREVKPG